VFETSNEDCGKMFPLTEITMRKFLLNSHAQALVEIALITPLLLVALYVTMDFGILFFTSHYTQNAVREAARIGAILPDCAIDTTVPPCVTTVAAESCPGTNQVVQEACARLTNRLTDATVAVTLTGSYFPATCMREVRVTASGTYQYGLYRVIALFGMPLPTSLTLTRSAAARYQGQPVTVTGTC
jgi:Flp pilus assembly protein TadG